MSERLDPPKINPLPEDGKSRPLWSVMIPTYNARADYLEETLRSILQQNIGPEEMQIEVVDDCSPSGAPLEVVKQIAGDRITVHRESKNLGLAGIWNRCIERARGEWVHILHQDDIVYPGFYASLHRANDDKRVGAAFVRHSFIDSEGRQMFSSALERESPAILENWSDRIAVRQLIQCPAIVVRRAVYQHMGGFLPQFAFVLDWEMWQRIAAHYLYYYDPAVLAGYRIHSTSATSRLTPEAIDIYETRLVIKFTMAYHAPDRAFTLAEQAKGYYAERAVQNARRLLVAGHAKAAWRQMAGSIRLTRSCAILWQTVLFFELQMRMLAASLKRTFLRRFRRISSSPLK